VSRSLQIVKNQKKNIKILQDELPVTSCAGENNSDLSLMFDLTQELKKKKEYFVSIFLDMQERRLTK
jgi:hypothetical protein